MLIDSKQIVSMTEANQNFSKVVRQAEENGCVVIFKNNNPKYALVDLEQLRISMEQSDDRLDKMVKKELNRAKWL